MSQIFNCEQHYILETRVCGRVVKVVDSQFKGCGFEKEWSWPSG